MLLQALADGVFTGAIIALGAIGVSFTLQIMRFANFAHSEFLTWGAYLTLALVTVFGIGEPLGILTFGWGLVVAAALAAVLTGLAAWGLDRLVFARLRRSGAQPLVLVFAAFMLSPKASRALGWLAVMALGLVMLSMALYAPQIFDPTIERIHFTFAAVVLPVISMLAGDLSAMRQRLQQQKAELQEAPPTGTLAPHRHESGARAGGEGAEGGHGRGLIETGSHLHAGL